MNGSRNGRPPRGRSIDLNADLGEGFPNDRTLLELVSSASICCGAHAGSDEVIAETLAAAKQFKVVVGAHPGYRDREGFGRREQNIHRTELIVLICEQIEHLKDLAAAIELDIRFLKPHGALYNQAQHSAEMAPAIVFAAELHHLPLLGLPGSLLESKAHEERRPFFAEGFPDRRYRDDGTLVPRSEPDAILHDPAEMDAQVLRLVNERRVSTLCIHGDDPRAVDNAERVRSVLAKNGIAVRSFLDESS
jgi:UPF0271 protein